MPRRHWYAILLPTVFASVSAIVVLQALSPPPHQTAVVEPAPGEYEPEIGQEGKDVVWVPTSPEMTELLLEMAAVTADDFVIDLGSGDGRNLIAAARRGARGLGVEFNPDMVSLSERLAEEAGVADRLQFAQGDMYEADISQATVLTLFLLPSNLERLKPTFLTLAPGTRIALNTFTFNDWKPDERRRVEGECVSWCTALLHIVPAKVAGAWQFDGGTLTLDQEYQELTGTFTRGTAEPVAVTGHLRGTEITLEIGRRTYEGRVDGMRMTSRANGVGGEPIWTATR